MMQRAHRPAAVTAVLLCLLATAACGGEGENRTLPSTLPSIERTVDEEPADSPEPTRTRTEKPEPTRTTEKPEPTGEPEPTRTGQQPQETEETPEKPSTTKVEVTVTVVPPKTTTPTTEATTPTPAATSSSAEVVPIAAEDDSGGVWGWILLFLLFAGLAAVLLISRSRRTATWDAEAGTLSAETRMVTEARLTPVLASADPVQRANTWPRVRADLAALIAGWGRLSTQPSDAARQARATGIAVLLRDLTAAVDAENEALASGRDWRVLRPQIEEILDGLDAAINPPGPQAPSPGGPPPSGPPYGGPPPSGPPYGGPPPTSYP
ncbi:hypothetical protein KZ829_07730 [Actinoplanes hulinensis]|uniref:Uncharacterized protein n=1 Tax=Actinoplanes hulinensis TaxID=1144547 RepID=A0ABS7AXZ2_9ACTN|nr:hypothetical protein [Actinoplanes hulinensis]MBW6433633.1 hypothetical protein [Actinoplanes hulinensis]